MYNQQIETFIKVADAGSFKKAAEIMYITPAAVIKQINILEQRLGVQLFYRNNRGLILTAGGQSLYQDSKETIEFCTKAVRHAKTAMERDNVVRVGISPTVSTEILQELWPQIYEICPNLHCDLVQLSQGHSAGRSMMMNLGKDVDIVVGCVEDTFLKEHHCNGIIIRQEPLYAGIPMTNPLLRKKRLEMKDLCGYTVCLQEPGTLDCMDQLRRDIESDYPEISIVDVKSINIFSINQCVKNGWVVPIIEPWGNTHPMLQLMSIDWDYQTPYGLMYAKEPSISVMMLIDALKFLGYSPQSF